MHKYMTLISVSLRAMLMTMRGTAQTDGKKKKGVSGVGMVALMGFLALYISFTYSFLLSSTMAPAGMLDMVPIMMAVMACLMSVLFTTFGASGIVFGGKDVDLLMSLPVPASSVIVSKMFALYLENLIFTVFMMIPSGVAYVVFGGNGTVGFFLVLILSAILLALLATILATVVGAFLAFFQSRSNGNPLVANLLYFALFGVIFIASFQMNSIMNGLVTQGDAINQAFSTWLLPFGLFQRALYGDFVSLLGLVALTLLPFLLLVWLLSLIYKPLLSKLNAHATRSDYKMQSLRTNGQFAALFKKEASRLFGTPIYLFNAAMGVLLAIVGCVFLCIQKDMVREFSAAFSGVIFGIACLCLAFCAVLTSPSSVSLSLEGKYLWILKEAPIDLRKLFITKAGVNAVLIWGMTVVCVPLVWYALNLTVLETAALFVLGIALGLYVSCFGLLMNVFFPKLDGVNDMLVIKQSASAVAGNFGGLVPVIALVFLYLFLVNFLPGPVVVLGISALLVLVALLLWKVIIRKGEKLLLSV